MCLAVSPATLFCIGVHAAPCMSALAFSSSALHVRLMSTSLQDSDRYDPEQAEIQPKHSKDTLMGAGKEMHFWLTTANCPLRALLRILSGGGVYYQAQISDKLGRAWLNAEGGKAELAHFQDAVLARHRYKEWCEARGVGNASSSAASQAADKPGGLL